MSYPNSIDRADFNRHGGWHPGGLLDQPKIVGSPQLGGTLFI
jgi:hypothetical protein